MRFIQAGWAQLGVFKARRWPQQIPPLQGMAMGCSAPTCPPKTWLGGNVLDSSAVTAPRGSAGLLTPPPRSPPQLYSRHEAEFGVDTDGTTLPQRAGRQQPLLSCLVVSGTVAALALGARGSQSKGRKGGGSCWGLGGAHSGSSADGTRVPPRPCPSRTTRPPEHPSGSPPRPR